MQQHNKKSQAIRCYVLLSIGLSAVFNLAQAQPTTVNYTGSVTAASCTIENGSTITVPLGAIKKHDFTSVQTEISSSTKTVEVRLKDCLPNSTLTLSLSGELDPSGNLKLKTATGPNMASGVAIAPLYVNAQGTWFWKGIGAGAPPVTTISTDANGVAVFKIGGSLVKRAANIAVIPGQVMASMTMTITAN